ncbi:glycosyltransferase [Geodermatophilus sp. SYSU D01106]
MSVPQLVVASAYGANGASTRVRVLDWLRFLHLDAEVHNYLGTSDVRPHTLLHHPLGVVRAERRLHRLARRPSIERLLVSRSVGPFTGGRREAQILQRAEWGVYDFDDALYADTRSGVYRFLGQAAGWARAVRAADLVIAGNALLAEAAADLNPNVQVIPSCVDPARIPLKQDHSVGSTPRLVWMGSPSTETYLQSIAPALLEVHRRTGARLLVISAGRRHLGDLEAVVDRVEWAGPGTDSLLTQADCGIMPLPDSPFTRGKCAYKLLQYGAAGLPAVASPVGVNAQVIRELGARSATDQESWVSALVESLDESVAGRRERGLAARAAVEDHYSFSAWGSAFRQALRLPDEDLARGHQEVPARSPR